MGKKLTYEEVKQYVEENGYELISTKYVRALNKLTFKCKNGHMFERTFAKFKSNKKCPYCDNSKGEKRIEDFLIKNNILFIPQKEYDNLLGLGGANLSYDFYLPDYNLLIEFQGIQHQEYRKGFQKDYSEFEKQLEHDERKRKYAKEHNINLLEIWYYDFDNIENILINNLNLK